MIIKTVGNDEVILGLGDGITLRIVEQSEHEAISDLLYRGIHISIEDADENDIFFQRMMFKAGKINER